MSNKHLSMLTI